ncbi:hypothetical protein D3C85_1334860 [compost metagenome]
MQLVRLLCRLVPADAADAGKSHGHAGLVAFGPLQALEGDLEHQAELARRRDGADGAETLDRVLAHELVELFQLFVGEAEIGLAHRGEHVDAVGVLGPDPEGVVGVEARALAVTALGVHQDGVDQMRIALPLEPGPSGAAGLVEAVEPFQHQPLGRLRIARRRFGATGRQVFPGPEGNERRQVDAV